MKPKTYSVSFTADGKASSVDVEALSKSRAILSVRELFGIPVNSKIQAFLKPEWK